MAAQVQNGPVPAHLPMEVFAAHMNGLQLHFSPGGQGFQRPRQVLYVLPDHVLHLIAAPVVASPPAALSAATKAAEQDTLAFVNTHHATVSSGLANIKQSADTVAFVREMEALEQRETADHAARLRRLFDSLIAAGQTHPAHRAQILATGQNAGGFLTELLHGAHDTLRGITHTIGGAVHGVGEAVVHAAKSAEHWVSGAAKSVSHFFGSLF